MKYEGLYPVAGRCAEGICGSDPECDPDGRGEDGGKIRGADFCFPSGPFDLRNQEAGARNCSSKSDALGNSEILSRRISGGGGNAAGN